MLCCVHKLGGSDSNLHCVFSSQEKEELLQQNAELRVKLESKVCIVMKDCFHCDLREAQFVLAGLFRLLIINSLFFFFFFFFSSPVFATKLTRDVDNSRELGKIPG